MANTIASIFGPSAEQLEYERQLEEQKRRDDMYATTLAGLRGDIPGFATGYALGYQGGEGLGQAIQGIFGTEPAKDPRLARARKSREIISKYGAGAFNDPTLLTQMANEMAGSDMLDEALALQNTANELRKNVPEQFITGTGEQLMARFPDKFKEKSLNKNATYQVSTKTWKADTLIAAKDADKEVTEGVIPGKDVGALNALTAIDESIDLAENEWGTTGFVGAVIRQFGTLTDFTDAGALGRTIETIEANIGFDRLQRMRDESKTGGALGQVAVKELEALRATIAAIKPSMGKDRLVANLKKVREQYLGHLANYTPEELARYGFDPAYAKKRPAKSIDVSGKVKSSNTGSVADRFNILNQLNQ